MTAYKALRNRKMDVDFKGFFDVIFSRLRSKKA